MNFIVERITDNIIYFVFPTTELMCRTMLRFAEHFEGPKYRKRVFHLRQFKRWYSFYKGSFSYYSDWSGFNIPSSAFESFRNGSFDPLSFGEKDVLAELPTEGDFYVIATAEDADDVIRHELAHACYYLVPEYKAKVTAVMNTLPGKNQAKMQMLRMGYHHEVLDDELHAYAGDGIGTLMSTLKVRSCTSWVGVIKWILAGRKLNKILSQTINKMCEQG